MSLNISARATNYPDPRFTTFFDDFFSDLYDNEVWSVVGTGSLTMQSINGGVIRVRATAGNNYEMNLGNIGCYSVANDFTCEWRGSLRPSGGGGNAECGMEGAGDQATNWICWRSNPGLSANFLCETGSGGTSTTTDSGIPRDTNNHLFKIVGSSGVIQFFLDDVPIVDLVSNITASQLQPYVWNVGGSGNSDALMDYVLVTGDRL